MFLKRKIEAEMQNWLLNSPGKALCIFGARQIGKTTSAEHFADQHFACVIKIDFIEHPQARKIFDQSADPQEIINQIELFSKKEIIPGQTLILLDEIQECPKARTAIKYLAAHPACRYIETGSLLGTRLAEIPSVPVGFEHLVNMYPLDFEEFLWANQVSGSVIENLHNCFQTKTPVPFFVHEEMKKIFLTYIAVGGMPESVIRFLQSRSIADCIPVQKSIWTLYAHDITKYAERSQVTRILELFESVPSQLNSSSIRFQLNKASGTAKARFESYQAGLSWLTQAGIVLPCFNTSEPAFPLRMNEKRRLFRLYLLDTGLLCSQFEGIQLKLIQQDPSLNWGAILENAAAQAFAANGFSLYYFNRKNLGELDFLLEQGDEITLIEMKSGNDYKHHPAVNAALQNPGWHFKKTIVFCSGNIEQEGEIIYLPWYLMFFIKKNTSDGQAISFNLEALSFE